MCKELQGLLEHGATWWSLVPSCAPWFGLFKPDTGCNGLVEPSNYPPSPPSLVYTPTEEDWARLNCAGLYLALVCALLGSGGLRWALLGYTRQYSTKAKTCSCKTIGRVHKLM